MKKINKSDYYKEFAQVSVNNMVMYHGAKCNNCNDKVQEFTVFIGKDQKLSTMYKSCCSECLSSVVSDAIKKGQEYAEEQFKAAEQRLYKESLEYVRKIKLNEIEK